MERERKQEEPIWPEDEADLPEEDEAEEDDWEDPNDPSHPDYDLSEAAGYGARDYKQGQPFPSQAFVALVSLLLLAAIAAPLLIRFLR